MSMNDQVADMLTRIRNAVAVAKPNVSMPSSKLKLGVAQVLQREGYIAGFEILPGEVENTLQITLKYGSEGEKVMSHIKRESKPGCRRYVGADGIKPVQNGLGISILSTNRGVLSDREALAQKIGGEVLCTIW